MDRVFFVETDITLDRPVKFLLQFFGSFYQTLCGLGGRFQKASVDVCVHTVFVQQMLPVCTYRRNNFSFTI